MFDLALTLTCSKQACITPDGNTLAIFDGLDGFDLFSTQTKQKVLHISMAGSARSPSPPMAFVHAGFMLVAGNSDGELRLWDIESGARLQRLSHGEWIWFPLFQSVRLIQWIDGEMIHGLTVGLCSIIRVNTVLTRLQSALSFGQTPLGDRFIIATITQADDMRSKIWIWRGVEVGE